MNESVALKIFTLGVRHGHKHAKFGLDLTKASDEYLGQFLFEAFKENKTEIELYQKNLAIEQAHGLFYAQYWTAKQSYRFGCIAGFETYPTIKPDKNGKIILTEEAIDILTQKQFAQVTNG